MATVGIPLDSIQNASDELFDHLCTICEENGRKAEARSCCKTCNKLMCDSCTKLHGQLYIRHEVRELRPSPDHVYQAEKVKQYDVKTKNDNKTPWIIGVCVLSDGNIVIADEDNRKIKLIDNRYQVIDEQRVSSYPQGLCHINASELAVSLNNDKFEHKIKFFNVVKKNITRTRRVKVDHWCGRITHCNGQLYVCGKREGLFVHDMDGTNKGTLYTGGWVRDVAMCPENQLVYVTVWDNGLVVLSNDGNVRCNLREEEIVGTSSVAIAGNRTVFVASYSSKTIIQVDREVSENMGTLATESDGLHAPWSLCVNYKTNELLVGQAIHGRGLVVIKLK